MCETVFLVIDTLLILLLHTYLCVYFSRSLERQGFCFIFLLHLKIPHSLSLSLFRIGVARNGKKWYICPYTYTFAEMGKFFF